MKLPLTIFDRLLRSTCGRLQDELLDEGHSQGTMLPYTTAGLSRAERHPGHHPFGPAYLALEALAALYLARWRAETNYAHLKTSMGLDVLKSKTVDGVLKELIVFALLYNLVRLVMWEAAKRQQVDVERISFMDALRWLASASDGEPLPSLVVNPHRPNRYEPRVRKRRPKPYSLMRKPREVLRNQLLIKPLGLT